MLEKQEENIGIKDKQLTNYSEINQVAQFNTKGQMHATNLQMIIKN